MPRKRRLRNRRKKVLEILHRPRPIPRLLARDRPRPTRIARRINKHRDVNMRPRHRMQRVQTFDHHDLMRLNALFAHARVRIETPARNVGRPTSAQLGEVARQPRKIRRLRQIAQVLRRCVVIRQVVVGAHHDRRERAGQRRLSRGNRASHADHRALAACTRRRKNRSARLAPRKNHGIRDRHRQRIPHP